MPNQNNKLLTLVKAKLGISTTVRDEYITALIDGIKYELKEFNEIEYVDNDPALDSVIAEIAAWRYSNVGNPSTPPFLRLMVNNLIVRGMKNGKQKNNL